MWSRGWDCWEDGALVADKASGVYIDDSKIRPLDRKGRFFRVQGPMSIVLSPQGHPVVVPELQRRSLLRREYEGQALRNHLGLPRAAAARLRQAAGAE
jgi:hypothetical protein